MMIPEPDPIPCPACDGQGTCAVTIVDRLQGIPQRQTVRLRCQRCDGLGVVPAGQDQEAPCPPGT